MNRFWRFARFGDVLRTPAAGAENFFTNFPDPEFPPEGGTWPVWVDGIQSSGTGADWVRDTVNAPTNVGMMNTSASPTSPAQLWFPGLVGITSYDVRVLSKHGADNGMSFYWGLNRVYRVSVDDNADWRFLADGVEQTTGIETVSKNVFREFWFEVRPDGSFKMSWANAGVGKPGTPQISVLDVSFSNVADGSALGEPLNNWGHPSGQNPSQFIKEVEVDTYS